MENKLEKTEKAGLDKKKSPRYSGVSGGYQLKKKLGKKITNEILSEPQGAEYDKRQIKQSGTQKKYVSQSDMTSPVVMASTVTVTAESRNPGKPSAQLNVVKSRIEKKGEELPPGRHSNEYGKDEKNEKKLYREHRFLDKKKSSGIEKKSEIIGKENSQKNGEQDEAKDEAHEEKKDELQKDVAGNTQEEGKRDRDLQIKAVDGNGDVGIAARDKKELVRKDALKKEAVHQEQAEKKVQENMAKKHAAQKEKAQEKLEKKGINKGDGDSYFKKETKSAHDDRSSFFRKIEKVHNASDILEHELTANYDAEERKKSAAKDYIAGKAKGHAQEMALNAAKKAGKATLVFTKKAAIQIVKWLFTAIMVLAPFLIMVIAAVTLVTVILSGLIYEEQHQDSAGGYFGKMYYWIEYETGKTDETAFSTVLGDGGRAFGIQFDYMYALQPFLRYCYGRNPIAYAPFQPYLDVDKSALLGSQALADAWLQVFEGNKEEFIEDQKQFAKMNYYDGIEETAEQFGLKLKSRNEVCKGAVLSYSFQCGSSSAYNAVEELAGVDDDEEFLKKIYEIRTARYPSFRSRYEREYSTALAIFRGQGSGDFVCPVDMSGCMVTSEFGEYRSPSDPAHKGTDFGSFGGANVPTYSIADGTVIIAGYSSSAGNWVVIDHGNGIVAKYMHHDSIRVAVGQTVRKGEQIGNMGTTGDSTGVHLHLQIEVDGVAVNSRNYITF